VEEWHHGGRCEVTGTEQVPVTWEPQRFQGRDLSKGWAWFVQVMSKLTADDFELFTGRKPGEG
jgi:hypothetical protein